MTQEPKSPSKTATTQRLLGQLGGIAQAVLSALVKVSGNVLQQAGKLWWNTLLPFVQSRLPTPWNQRLTKPILTGITIALLTLILWLTSTLSRPAVSSVGESPANPTEADRPSQTTTRPEPAVTPEKLVRIQEKLAQVTEPYGEAFILTVQPGVRHHLTLTVDNRWYALPPESQDQLTRALWDRSRQLDYAQLEILDLEDRRIARSPVVGQQMLILRRLDPLLSFEPAEPAIEPGLDPALESALEPAPELAAPESASESDLLDALDPEPSIAEPNPLPG